MNPELMRQIADEMEKYPKTWWKGFQYLDDEPMSAFRGSYRHFHRANNVWRSIIDGDTVRRAPRTVHIDVHVPEPMREPPEKSTEYYTISNTGTVAMDIWINSRIDRKRLAAGMAWLEHHEAEAASHGIFGALGVNNAER